LVRVPQRSFLPRRHGGVKRTVPKGVEQLRETHGRVVGAVRHYCALRCQGEPPQCLAPERDSDRHGSSQACTTNLPRFVVALWRSPPDQARERPDQLPRGLAFAAHLPVPHARSKPPRPNSTKPEPLAGSRLWLMGSTRRGGASALTVRTCLAVLLWLTPAASTVLTELLPALAPFLGTEMLTVH